MLRQNVQEKNENSAECHIKQKKEQGVSGSNKNKKNLCIVLVWHKKKILVYLNHFEKPGYRPGAGRNQEEKKWQV